MDTNVSDELQLNFDKLQLMWPNCSLDSVCGTDMYYTDGAADGAAFKITFKQGALYITTVYVMKNGDWFSSDYRTNILIKTTVNKWIDRVRSDMLACKLGIPSLPTT